VAADLEQNPNERRNREIHRRTDMVGILPNRESAIRLSRMVLAELLDKRTPLRRYIGLDVIKRC
jgi:transposase-like protein